MENELVFISGKIIWEKQYPVRITFSRKTGQPMSTTWRRGIFFYRTSARGCFWVLRLFSFRFEKGRRTFEEKKKEILQRDIIENSNNLVQSQEKIAVSGNAPVVKMFALFR